MFHILRIIALGGVFAALLLAPGLASAQEPSGSLEVAACQPGAGYTSGCDVDQDGDIDILDVQLTAGRWNSSGVYTAGHTHWGETWTGTGVVDGLRVEHTAASGYAYSVTGQSASTSGRGVYGYVSAASGATYGVQGQSASSAGRGVYGLATASTGSTSGVFGESASSGGHGVYGVATAASGDTDGVFGEAASTSGRGVRGLATAASGVTTGVMGTATSTAGRGVYGMAPASTGAAYGVYGESASTAGRGVYGKATASSGQAFGVHGVSESDNGRGLFGHATSASGSTYGVVGQTASTVGTGVQGLASTSTGINYGVWGLSSSTAGTGVLGQASALSGTTFGVYGQSSSDAGYGVYGVTWANTGVTYGVYGRSLSTSGYAGYFTGQGGDAVFVENTGIGRGLHVSASADTAIWAETATGIAAVDGRADGSTGRGVYGYATATTGANSGVYGRSKGSEGRGVYGWAEATSGVNYGVYGRTSSASGYAGYFQGDLHTTGTLSKAGGSFKIDHPLDPANQYLYHSFVESPDMLNIYNGNLVLDDQGEAGVAMPDWFEALNQDFRYQLTPIGGWAPLYIAQEIQGNAFRIAGGEPGMKVSWMVTGIRHDAYANAHRIPVEEPKPAGERGLYLHPAELDQPAELGLDYQRTLDPAE